MVVGPAAIARAPSLLEVDVSDVDEPEYDGERLGIVVLDAGRMYGLSFVPRPPRGAVALMVSHD